LKYRGLTPLCHRRQNNNLDNVEGLGCVSGTFIYFWHLYFSLTKLRQIFSYISTNTLRVLLQIIKR